ncbi:hypothetical protein BDP27DRAFT_1428643 [Rhodocollybia butyracea]|uniref:Uncharacterized protein n=1 Tax=Rhodocollybia butyracea TaxID=206335 RepID=A0A9P5PD90_9AGAR|nr:hypothetical protein BDP27DRAFT_1428643 [Rhodocollybia butyracea]
MGDEVSELFDVTMRPSMNSLIFQFLFYGAYIILGSIYVSLQLQQRKVDKKFQHPFYPVSLLVLFVLATGGIIVSVYDVENIIQEFILLEFTSQDPNARLENLVNYRTATKVLYGTANSVADGILVYRCYHVWNGKIWIPLIPAVLSVVNAAISYAATATIKIGADELFATGQSNEVNIGDRLDYIFLGVNVFNNLLLTGLIAGRMWWSNRVHSRLLGIDGQDKRLNAIVSMFVESGTLYPIALVVCLIIQVKGSVATMHPILLQIVGIAPTLIMVRTSLGLSASGGSPHRSEAEREPDEKQRPPTYYNTDVKEKISSNATGSLPTSSFPTRSLPSESASPSRHTYAHNDIRTVSVSEPSEVLGMMTGSRARALGLKGCRLSWSTILGGCPLPLLAGQLSLRRQGNNTLKTKNCGSYDILLGKYK